MSTVKWMAAALALATLSLPALADPLLVSTSTTGRITSVENNLWELGDQLQAGMPITVDFENEVNFSHGTAEPGSLGTSPDQLFRTFGLAADGHYLGLHPIQAGLQVPNQIRLRDDVLNAAGEMVDVFELTGGGQTYPNESYTMTTRLEFASTTFDGLDAWSALALRDAPLLDGTIDLYWSSLSYDGIGRHSTVYADVDRFDVQFSGPGSEVPAVPEPEQ